MLFAVFALPVRAAHPLGNTTEALLGGDITDPTNRIVSGSTNVADFAAATWISAISANKAFYSGEGPCNMFANTIGANNQKWYDSVTPSEVSPAYIALEFPSAFTLTHFTLAAGNDSFPSRHPSEWKIQGSNDGIIWSDVYVHSGDAPFTGTNQVYLFSSFSDQTLASSGLNAAQQKTVTDKLGAATYSADTFNNDTAYSWYKLEVTELGSTDKTQLGELELFGYTKQSYVKTSGGGMFPNAVYHMDAGNTASITQDGDGNVSAWADTNGNGLSFNQSEEARRPSLSTMKIGDKDFAAIKFTAEGNGADSVNDALTLNTSPNTQTLFIVNEADAHYGLSGIIGAGQGSAANSGDYGIRMGGNSLQNAFWQSADNNDFTTGTNGSIRYNGSTATGYDVSSPHLLAATRGTNAGNKLLNSNITLGGYFRNGSGTRPYDGKIAEVIGFAGLLDATEIAFVETYLGDKYGLAIAGARAYETGNFGGQQFFVGKTANWDVSNNGTGGFGIATASDPAVPFDLFGNALLSLSEGTMLMATANTDAAFGTTGITIGGENYDMWEKEWYIDVTNPTSADDALFLAFNAVDALYNGAFDDATDWNLLFSDDGTTFSILTDTGSLENGTLLFNLGLNDLASGYYSIGAQSSSAVPEPSTWLLMALGLLAGWRVARRRKG